MRADTCDVLAVDALAVVLELHTHTHTHVYVRRPVHAVGVGVFVWVCVCVCVCVCVWQSSLELVQVPCAAAVNYSCFIVPKKRALQKFLKFKFDTLALLRGRSRTPTISTHRPKDIMSIFKCRAGKLVNFRVFLNTSIGCTSEQYVMSLLRFTIPFSAALKNQRHLRARLTFDQIL